MPDGDDDGLSFPPITSSSAPLFGVKRHVVYSCSLGVFKLFYVRVMIEYHPKIQLFTTLPMWQGGPPLLFEFFLFFKNKLR